MGSRLLTKAKRKAVSMHVEQVFLLLFLLLALAAPLSCTSGGEETDGDVTDGDPSDGDADGDEEAIDGDSSPDGDPEEMDGDAPDDGDVDVDGDDVIPDPGTLVVAPDPIDFGLLPISDQAASLSFTLSNGAAAKAEEITVTSVELNLSSDPDLAIDECSPPYTLKPGEEQDCSITCLPTDLGAHDGTLRVVGRSADGTPLEVRVEVHCGTAIPMLKIDPAVVEFGYVPQGESAFRFVSIGNAGLSTLELSTVRLVDDPQDFEILTADRAAITGEYEMSSGVVFEIRFTPSEEQQQLVFLEIESNDPQTGTFRIPISGRALADCPENTTEEGASCLSTCLPGMRRCGDISETPLLCSEDGSAWEDRPACGENQRCEGGFCVWSICDVGAVFCSDGASEVCGDSGDEVKRTTACSDDPDCPDICIPGGGCSYPQDNHYCFDSNRCTNDVCEKGSGCSNPFNSEPCEDKDLCTQNSVCTNGACRGVPVDCDDSKVCTRDACDPLSGCFYDAVEGGCDDGDPCTVSDACNDKACLGQARDCEDGNDCTTDSCDPNDGCMHTPSGSVCNDGNPCTEEDACTTEICRGSPINPDDGKFCNGVEYCDPNSAEGEAIVSPTPVICNDNIACTIDSCKNQGNGCDYLPDHEFCDDGNPCTIDECLPATGCVHSPEVDFEDCVIHPGLTEICLDGQCVFGCEGDDDCQDGIACTFDFCDMNSGYCRNEPVDGNCSNGLWCDGEELCDLLRGCVPGESVDCNDVHACTNDDCDEESRSCTHLAQDGMCDDLNDCTLDICRPGDGCIFLANEGICDDGDPCTLGDACHEGQCESGLGELSCEDGNPCTDNLCVPGVGCGFPANNQMCDDGDPCTDFDTCLEGLCRGSSLKCDDGLFCNGVESCEGEDCAEGQPVVCDDQVSCTVDSCNEEAGECEFVESDELCVDNNPCTVNETCTGGACTFDVLGNGADCGLFDGKEHHCYDGFCVAPCQTENDCDDEIACTENTCNQQTGHCDFIPNHASCDNVLYCDGVEICDRVESCIQGEAIDCDDSVDCTVDSCSNAARKCVNTPDNDACASGNPCQGSTCTEFGCQLYFVENECDDNNPCTIDDECRTGECMGQQMTCDDKNPCTEDLCGFGGQCFNTNVIDGSSCGSGIVTRVCVAGSCVSGCNSDESCDDGISCTIDTCHPESFQCSSVASDDLCNDGLFCNGIETCDAVEDCIAGEIVECDDQVACTVDECDEAANDCRNEGDNDFCDDGNPCSDDICTISGCESENNTLACNDHNLCTEDDVCSGGACEGEPVTCDDADACTENLCDDYQGCYFVDNRADCSTELPCKVAHCDKEEGCQIENRSGSCDDGNPCTAGDICEDGACLGPIEEACEDHNPCTIDVCDPVDGCSNIDLISGEECQIAGALPGYCVEGMCRAGCERDSDCADGVFCTVETCNIQINRCELVADHGQCDDGLFCNGEERCLSFVGCVRGERMDCSDGVDCTADLCDEDVDACSNPAVDALCDDANVCTTDTCDEAQGCTYENTDGPCDDGLLCTSGDTCEGGSCSGETVDCDDSNPCTGPDLCDENLGCTKPPKDEDEDCGDDGICIEGQCAETCSMDYECDDQVPCTIEICDLSLGRCRYFEDNEFCDDGSFCNGVETCHSALGCMPGVKPNCDDGLTCTLDTCSDSAGACEFVTNDAVCNDDNICTLDSCDIAIGCAYTAADGLFCDDRDACTTGDVCDGGLCVGGTPPECEGSEVCHTYTCDPRVGCIDIPRWGDSCDGGACSETAECVAGDCVIVQEVNCDDQNSCTVESCDSVSGCRSDHRNGEACDDYDLCVVNGSCNFYNCQGVARDCDDSNPCTFDDCEFYSGCTHVPYNEEQACTTYEAGDGECVAGTCAPVCDGPCSDQNACTVEDSCEEGRCIGVPKDCDDQEICTIDTCNPDGGGCIHEALSDGRGCQTAAGATGTCNSGACERLCTTNAECEDDNPCTDDVCSEQYGCLNEPNDSECDDEDPCTTGDRCMAGDCRASSTLDCDDHNPCTDDTCTADGGCINVGLDDSSLCDDDDPCTINDACFSNLCQGTLLDCDDGNDCTYDICSSGGACIHSPISGLQCDDSNACSTGSVCMGGVCTGSGVLDCDDGNSCTRDICERTGGCRLEDLTGPFCEDEDLCSQGDSCILGVCVSGEMLLDCQDEDPCTEDICDENDGCDHLTMEEGDTCDLDPLLPEACFQGACIEFCDNDDQCDDALECTVDTCEMNTNTCLFTPDDDACDDEEACNGGEVCDSVEGCMPGTPPDCDDAVDCTDDACDFDLNGCVYQPQDYLCDDGDPCTVHTCDPEQGCMSEDICGN